MATVPTEFKRLFLRSIAWDAEEKGQTLWDAIKCVSRCKISYSSGANGLYLIGTAAHGHSVTYQLPTGAQGFSPSLLTELCEEIITRYEMAVAAFLALTPSVTTPTDTQLLTEMLAMLVPATEVYADSYSLRTWG